MARWTATIPEYSRPDVNRAGNVLISKSASQEEIDKALIIINNWRASHYTPLNTFQKRLRTTANKINTESLIAQRIKRLASIKLKLERYSDMKLSQIQDIGGCRAIMKNVSEVDRLVDIYLNHSSGLKHELSKPQDYIANPKTSGYRGVHLIYKYRSDKTSNFDDLKIEIQIRTLIQHAWATAVETVGTFIGQSLKSSQGEEDWLLFFTLMSSAMAISEGKPTVPNTPDNLNDLIPEIIRLEKKLGVEGHLNAFRNSMTILADQSHTKDAHYYLLELDPDERRVIIKSYTQTQLPTASLDYLTIEKRIKDGNRNAVLVSADSVEALKLAYPNYYLDTELFLQEFTRLIGTRQLSLF